MFNKKETLHYLVYGISLKNPDRLNKHEELLNLKCEESGTNSLLHHKFTRSSFLPSFLKDPRSSAQSFMNL